MATSKGMWKEFQRLAREETLAAAGIERAHKKGMMRANGLRGNVRRAVIGSATWMVIVLGLWGRESASGETTPNFRWAHKFDAPNNYVGALDVDPVGNIYFVGSFRDKFLFKDIVLNGGGPVYTGGGMFLAKCDRTGNPVWAVREGYGGAAGVGVGLDAAGNIYTLCDLSLAGMRGTPLAGNTVTGRLALVKYDRSGQATWAKVLAKGSQDAQIWPITSVPSVDQMGNSCWSVSLKGLFAFRQPTSRWRRTVAES